VEAGVSNGATKEKENLNKVKGSAQAACAVQANFHKVKVSRFVYVIYWDDAIGGGRRLSCVWLVGVIRGVNGGRDNRCLKESSKSLFFGMLCGND